MKKEDLIKWKNIIESINSDKYIAISIFNPEDIIEINELTIKNINTKNVVDNINGYYEKNILSYAGVEKFNEAILTLSIYLVTENKGDIDLLNTEYIDDIVLVKPSVCIVGLDGEFVEIETYNCDDILPNFVVSYNDFFKQMSLEGYDFNVKPFEEFKKSINCNNKSGVVSCIVNFQEQKRY